MRCPTTAGPFIVKSGVWTMSGETKSFFYM
jgi:hypothetical protein